MGLHVTNGRCWKYPQSIKLVHHWQNAACQVSKDGLEYGHSDRHIPNNFLNEHGWHTQTHKQTDQLDNATACSKKWQTSSPTNDHMSHHALYFAEELRQEETTHPLHCSPGPSGLKSRRTLKSKHDWQDKRRVDVS